MHHRNSKNILEEDMMVAIQNDNKEEFINIIQEFKNWENYFLKDEEQYFIHYAISNNTSLNI